MFCCLSPFFCFSREQKDPVYLRDKVSQKHSKEQFENAQKIEQEYSKFFTGVCVQTDNLKQGSECWRCADGAFVLQVLSRVAASPTFALRS